MSFLSIPDDVYGYGIIPFFQYGYQLLNFMLIDYETYEFVRSKDYICNILWKIFKRKISIERREYVNNISESEKNLISGELKDPIIAKIFFAEIRNKSVNLISDFFPKYIQNVHIPSKYLIDITIKEFLLHKIAILNVFI